MLERKTVFVIGAGASAELNMPVGWQLKPKIVDALKVVNNNPYRSFSNDMVEMAVLDYMQDTPHSAKRDEYQRYVIAARWMEQALPIAESIDQFLDSHRQNERVVRLGKIGIAAAILDAERNSLLGGASTAAIKPSNGRSALSNAALDSWHMKLVRLITAGKSIEEVASLLSEISFIVFNYDRCLEQYLFRSLTTYYGQNTNITAIIKSLNIVHPYGQIGFLHWQSDEPTIAYGATEGELRPIADELLTFTQAGDCGQTSRVKKMIEDAESLIFLGFGFLEQNVELLASSRQSNVERVFFTSKGISESDNEFVRQDIEKICQRVIKTLGQASAMNDITINLYETVGTCSKMMDDNRMRMNRALA